MLHENGMMIQLQLDCVRNGASVHITLTDMTERKQIEQTLKESELRSVIDSLTAHVAVLDEQGVIIAVNDSWTQFAQQNGGANVFITVGVNYLNVCRYLNYDEMDSIYNGIMNVLSGTEDVFRTEYPCHSPTENRFFSMIVSPLKGGKRGVVISHENITERKQIEQALKESEFLWKFAIEGSQDGLWDWNIQTNKFYFSPRWKEMFGSSSEEIGNDLKDWQRLIHPDDKAKVMERIESYFNGEHSTVYVSEHRLLCKDGYYKWVLARGVIVDYTENGKPLRMMGTSTDISNQKQTEATLQQLVEQERANSIEQSKFIAMLAHELKNPLATVHLSLGLMNNESDEILSIANKAIQDIQDLMRRCLQSEKLKDNKVNIHIEKYDVLNKLSEIKKNISFPERLVIIAKPDLILETDGQLLYLVLFNLIDNALKYSPPQSIVKVNVEPSDSNFVVTVENEIGIAGIPDETKVFQKYYRNKTAHYEIGSGLGLYLVKEILNLLSGDVIYSCDNKYVCFTLRLPFLTAQIANCEQ